MGGGGRWWPRRRAAAARSGRYGALLGRCQRRALSQRNRAYDARIGYTGHHGAVGSRAESLFRRASDAFGTVGQRYQARGPAPIDGRLLRIAVLATRRNWLTAKV